MTFIALSSALLMVALASFAPCSVANTRVTGWRTAVPGFLRRKPYPKPSPVETGMTYDCNTGSSATGTARALSRMSMTSRNRATVAGMSRHPASSR